MDYILELDYNTFFTLLVLVALAIFVVVNQLYFKKRIAKIMQGNKDFIISVIDDKIKANVSFDSKFEVVTWEGAFEQFQVEFKSWLTYNYVEFTKEDYVLGIKYDKDVKKENYLSYLPYEVKLNTKYFYCSSLKNDTKEYKFIEKELESFFKEGKSINFEGLSTKSKEILDIIIFGYFTYNRFIGFIEKHFPEFCNKMYAFEGKPISEILDVFKSSNLSKEELKIALKKAVSEEDFEKASFLRDKIKLLKTIS